MTFELAVVIAYLVGLGTFLAGTFGPSAVPENLHRPLGLAGFSLLLVSALLYFYVPSTDPAAVATQGARFEVVQVIASAKSKPPPPEYVIDFKYVNRGAVPSVEPRFSVISTLATREMTDAEVDRAFHSLLSGALRTPLARADANELPPGQGGLFRYPGMIINANQWRRINDGSARLYLLMAIKYADALTPRDAARITEFCGIFTGPTFDTWSMCNKHNRTYVAAGSLDSQAPWLGALLFGSTWAALAFALMVVADRYRSWLREFWGRPAIVPARIPAQAAAPDPALLRRERLEFYVIAYSVYGKEHHLPINQGPELMLHRHLKDGVANGYLQVSEMAGPSANVMTTTTSTQLLQFAQRGEWPELREFAERWAAARGAHGGDGQAPDAAHPFSSETPGMTEVLTWIAYGIAMPANELNTVGGVARLGGDEAAIDATLGPAAREWRNRVAAGTVAVYGYSTDTSPIAIIPHTFFMEPLSFFQRYVDAVENLRTGVSYRGIRMSSNDVLRAWPCRVNLTPELRGEDQGDQRYIW